MTALSPWIKRFDDACARLQGMEWIPQLLMRVSHGYFFFESGWGKIHNLDTFTQRFTEWGIPMPAFNAALSAYTRVSRRRTDHARSRHSPDRHPPWSST